MPGMVSPCRLLVGLIKAPVAMNRARPILRWAKRPNMSLLSTEAEHPQPLPGNPERALASMGIYIFNTRMLFDELARDRHDESSTHDFGRDIIPSLIRRYNVFAFPFRDPQTGAQAYWRDVGTIDAYFAAHQDLLGAEPKLDLFNPRWRIGSSNYQGPSPKFFHAELDNSIISAGASYRGWKYSASELLPSRSSRCLNISTARRIPSATH